MPEVAWIGRCGEDVLVCVGGEWRVREVCVQEVGRFRGFQLMIAFGMVGEEGACRRW